jgi:hypothetical protein
MSTASFRFSALEAQDPDTVGGFRLVARLGEGGMGQVFLALSPGGQPAAVKVIRAEFARDAEFGQRFAREVHAAQKVRGAHLAPLLGADPGGDRPWLATVYVAGPSLRELVTDYGPLPTAQVMLLAWGIAHALADIHAAEVVHRDLKPDNIMVDESGPKVIDFGIVKSLTQSVTYKSRSTRIGTPLYMSPEQAMGRPVGAPTDIFALGAALYYLASGREAFAAENEWAVAHRITADDPDLSALAPPLRQMIAACLRKDPAQRPAPERVREWCEEELGGAPGPGAWMGITGARAEIQKRTSALRVLTAPASGADDTVSKTPTVVWAPPPVAGSQKLLPRKTAVTGGDYASHIAQVVVASGVLAWASSLPIMSEFWKNKASGDLVAHVTEFFNLHHPWTPVPSGIPGVSTDWQVAPVGVIGTAVGLVCAVLTLLQWSKDPDLRAWGKAARVVSVIWLVIVAVMAVFIFMMTIGIWISDDNPSYSIRSVLMPGGWLLIAANGLMLIAQLRMAKRAPKGLCETLFKEAERCAGQLAAGRGNHDPAEPTVGVIQVVKDACARRCTNSVSSCTGSGCAVSTRTDEMPPPGRGQAQRRRGCHVALLRTVRSRLTDVGEPRAKTTAPAPPDALSHSAQGVGY